MSPLVQLRQIGQAVPKPKAAKKRKAAHKPKKAHVAKKRKAKKKRAKKAKKAKKVRVKVHHAKKGRKKSGGGTSWKALL